MPDRGKDAKGALGELPLHEPTDPQGYARRHLLRLAILALLSSKRCPERAARDLSAELPGLPDLAVVEYHLGVLRQVGLVSEHETGASAVYSLV